jgi:hypothetical protein
LLPLKTSSLNFHHPFPSILPDNQLQIGRALGNTFKMAGRSKSVSNQQHQRLKVHAQANPNTLYVAPEFNTIDEFNAAFLARQITAKSRIIPVADRNDVFDGDQHHITFQNARA